VSFKPARLEEGGDHKISDAVVRFANERGYFICENDVFALPLQPIEKLTYLALTRYAGANNQAWPAYETLARDASCSKRRAITAVKNLISCCLLEKQVRSNKTNLYLIYSPSYFKEKKEVSKVTNHAPPVEAGVNHVHSGGEPRAPQKISQGEQRAPRGCTTFTPEVNQVHPKSNKKNNNENLSLIEGTLVPGNESGSEDKSEDELLNEEPRFKSVKRVQDAFKKKGSVISERATEDLLSRYAPKLIIAAINNTDFKVARNPLAVVKWMLSNETYTLPVERAPTVPSPLPEPPGPAEDAQIRQMIREAKTMLRGHPARPSPAAGLTGPGQTAFNVGLSEHGQYLTGFTADPVNTWQQAQVGVADASLGEMHRVPGH